MIGWIVSTLLATSALMLLVLAVRRPVADHFGPRAAYALWLLPALRMVLPPLPEAVTPAIAPDIDVAALIAAARAAPVEAVADGGWSVDWWLVVAAAWLAVAAVRFALPWLAYRRYMSRALDGGRVLARERGVAVYLSRRLAGPLAAGVVRRRIVLPHDFHLRFDPAEQRLALAHEAAHHARGDTLANLVALAVLALHWWNPIAHIAWRAFRADQELACDAIVLKGKSADEAHAYGSALLKAAFGGTPAAACGMAHAAELKRRLRMMATRRDGMRARTGPWLAGALVAGGLIGTASGGAAAEKVRAFGEQVRHALPEVPAIPAVPTLPERAEIAALPPLPPVPAAARGKRIVIVDGKVVEGALPAAAPIPPLPPRAALAPLPPLPPLPPVAGRTARDAAEAARDAAEARREALEAQIEARQAAREGEMAALQARLEAQQSAREAAIEAAQARREAQQAAREAALEAAQARREAWQSSQAGARAMVEAQRSMARACATRGMAVSASERDFGKLALCNGALLTQRMRAALTEARRSIAGEDEIGAARRQAIVASLDREIARLDARR